MDDLHRAIELARNDADSSSANSAHLAIYLVDRFQQTGAREDIVAAVVAIRRAVATGAADDPLREIYLDTLGSTLCLRYGGKDDMAHLLPAIGVTEDPLKIRAISSLAWGQYLDGLRRTLYEQYEHSEKWQDLNSAIEVAEGVTAMTPVDDRERVRVVCVLSELYLERFKARGAADDIGAAVRLWEAEAAATPPGHFSRCLVLSNLSTYFGRRYRQMGELEDIHKAIHVIQQAIDETAVLAISYRGLLFRTLSQHLHRRFERLGDIEDLELGVRACEEALELTPQNDLTRPALLENLSHHFTNRYLKLKELGDLEKAVRATEESVFTTPAMDPARAGRLSMLSMQYRERAEQLGDSKDEEKAIETSEMAVAATPLDDPVRSSRTLIQSSYLFSRYLRLGLPDDLQNSIRGIQDALALAAVNSTDRVIGLGYLGVTLYLRFEHSADPQDLEFAVQATEEAIRLTPGDHPGRPAHLSNLSWQLCMRYQQFRALTDLTAAIEALQEVLVAISAASAQCDSERGIVLSQLSHCMMCRYESSWDQDDLETAIRLGEEALSLTPTDQPVLRAEMMHKLGSYHMARFGASGRLPDLDIAIQASSEAVILASDSFLNRSLIWNKLSNHLRCKFELTNDTELLRRAMVASEMAIKTSVEGHPNRSNYLLSHARLLHAEFSYRGSARTDPKADRDDFVLFALLAFLSPLSRPSLRIEAALFAATCFVSLDKWQSASYLLTKAVQLLPQTCPQFLQRIDQEHVLTGFEQLASLACSTSIRAGSSASDCLALLELGRGIMIGFAINLRSDLSELQVRDRALYEKFNSQRIKLDSQPVEMNIPLGPHPHTDGDQYRRRAEAERRHKLKLIAEQDETLACIRQMPGMEGFQLPPSAQHFLTMGNKGPIIIFNSTSIQSDAIILTCSSITSLALPKMINSEVYLRLRRLTCLTRGKRSTYPARNRAMEQVLLWLWDVAVEPVLEVLQLGPVDDETKLPRVWWIGVGSLAMAPFHAAGDHTPGSTRNTLSRVISSYIPTIKSLSYAREKKLTIHGTPAPRILLVTMPTTPDTPNTPMVPANTYIRGTSNTFSTSAIPGTPAIKWASLPNAGKEVDDIMGAVQDTCSANMTRLDSPSPTQVLAELPRYNIIHFACHGVSDYRTPSASHLLLSGLDQPGKLSQRRIQAEPQRCADCILVRVLHCGQSVWHPRGRIDPHRERVSAGGIQPCACDAVAVG